MAPQATRPRGRHRRGPTGCPSPMTRARSIPNRRIVADEDRLRPRRSRRHGRAPSPGAPRARRRSSAPGPRAPARRRRARARSDGSASGSYRSRPSAIACIVVAVPDTATNVRAVWISGTASSASSSRSAIDRRSCVELAGRRRVGRDRTFRQPDAAHLGADTRCSARPGSRPTTNSVDPPPMSSSRNGAVVGRQPVRAAEERQAAPLPSPSMTRGLGVDMRAGPTRRTGRGSTRRARRSSR